MMHTPLGNSPQKVRTDRRYRNSGHRTQKKLGKGVVWVMIV